MHSIPYSVVSLPRHGTGRSRPRVRAVVARRGAGIHASTIIRTFDRLRAQRLERESGGVTSGHIGKPIPPSTGTPEALDTAPASGMLKAEDSPQGVSASANLEQPDRRSRGRPPVETLASGVAEN
ncbi:hypothetical protein ACSFA8_26620 [Variovorax sp. RT4R15]|uniref:hypothetical protein n=1 Tax=Variovorax sp. RT4R15 TaxID=3443737 RepID=UPI003F452809